MSLSSITISMLQASTPNNMPLKDIHLPEVVSWWPPAIGWWLLLGLIIILLITFQLWKKRCVYYTAIKIATSELDSIKSRFKDHQNNQQLLSELSILLRRVYISYYPREDIAQLIGDAWLERLDAHLPEQPFTKGTGKILAYGPYQNNHKHHDLNTDDLLQLCGEWIKAFPNAQTLKASKNRNQTQEQLG